MGSEVVRRGLDRRRMTDRRRAELESAVNHRRAAQRGLARVSR